VIRYLRQEQRLKLALRHVAASRQYRIQHHVLGLGKVAGGQAAGRAGAQRIDSIAVELPWIKACALRDARRTFCDSSHNEVNTGTAAEVVSHFCA
jgi:hypothetical protein